MLNPGLDDVLPRLALDRLPILRPSDWTPPHSFLGHTRRDHKPGDAQVKADPHLDRPNPGQNAVEESMLDRHHCKSMLCPQCIEYRPHLNHSRPFTLLSRKGEHSVLKYLVLIRIVNCPASVPRAWDVDADDDHASSLGSDVRAVVFQKASRS